MIAYCGMDCSKCEGYLATQADSGTKRKEVAEKWTVQYNTEIKPQQINCNRQLGSGHANLLTLQNKRCMLR